MGSQRYHTNTQSMAHAAETLKDEWVLHATTHDLPNERIPQIFRRGESGETLGFPRRMVGDSALAMLHARRITRLSQLIQLARRMNEKQFQAIFGGRPSWAYLTRIVEANPTKLQEYVTRKRFWTASECRANINILRQELLPLVRAGDVLLVDGREVNQRDWVNRAITENQAHLDLLTRLQL